MENRFLELKNISKFFGDCCANKDVSFSVKRGSIHAIVGENGAGKSTAMKILYGQYPATSGEIYFEGKARHWKSPRDSIQAGIGMVHQHFMLAHTHTALENIILGMHSWPLAFLGVKAARKKLEKIMADYGIIADLDARIEDCPVGIQQKIEILKLLYRDSDVLILDEPTAVLAPSEIEVFFQLLKKMAGLGKTIIIITHKLKEVMSLADRVTVFRAGVVVAEREIKETSIPELAALMVGEEIHLETKLSRSTPQEILLELKNFEIKGFPSIKHNFAVRAGEILGIAGVEGNGQSELIQALLSPEEFCAEGEMLWQGKQVVKFSTEKIRSLGMAVLPEDRLKEGLLLGRSIFENFVLRWRSFLEFSESTFLPVAKMRVAALSELERYSVRPLSLDAIAGDLSGGNQQKMVVARELYGKPNFLLAAQPTRGVDIGAVQFIHDKILEKKNEGVAVLLVSSELDELIKLSDRILVIYRGKFVSEFSRGDFDEKKIGFFMIGGDSR